MTDGNVPPEESKKYLSFLLEQRNRLSNRLRYYNVEYQPMPPDSFIEAVSNSEFSISRETMKIFYEILVIKDNHERSDKWREFLFSHPKLTNYFFDLTPFMSGTILKVGE